MARQLPIPGKPIKRFPYVWVTWLAGVLSGDKQCWWAVWQKSQFALAKRPDPSFDKAAWSADHDRLVNMRALQLAADGWIVNRERQNEFKLAGAKALLAGKCDIIAFRGADVRVSDAKTGQTKKSDFWQVLIYMFALPKVRHGLGMGGTISGEVVYGGVTAEGEAVIVEIADVRPEDLTESRYNEIADAMKRIGRSEPLEATPSGSECGFCDVTVEDCQYFVTPSEATTDAF